MWLVEGGSREGVQGVRTPAPLIRCPFWKRTYFQNGRRFVGFWAYEEQNSPKWEIPCPGRPWTIVQNLTPLALSPAEKSVTVQSDKFTNKQTNSYRHIHTLSISMCGNDNQWLKLNKNSVGQHQLRILTQIAYDALADPLVGWGGEYHSPFPTPSTPLASRRLWCPFQMDWTPALVKS